VLRPQANNCHTQFWKIVVALIVFGIAFGYVEAAIVAYLRYLYNPLRLQFYPGTSGQIFPLLSIEQLRQLGPEHVRLLKTELGRELATLLMLAGVALVAARKAREFVAAFLVCFGVWDITFYLFLRVLLHWPASLLTWDILFLIPVPWTGPVIAPVLVSLSMVGCGVMLLRCEYAGKPLQLSQLQWALIVVGGVLIMAAFVWDFRNTASGGNPRPFNWTLFIAGETIGTSSFLGSFRRRRGPAERIRNEELGR
jgi:hypothetical protein